MLFIFDLLTRAGLDWCGLVPGEVILNLTHFPGPTSATRPSTCNSPRQNGNDDGISDASLDDDPGGGDEVMTQVVVMVVVFSSPLLMLLTRRRLA